MKSETVPEQPESQKQERSHEDVQQETQVTTAGAQTVWKEPKMYVGAISGALVAVLFRRFLLHDMFHTIAGSTSMFSALALFSVIGGVAGAALTLEDRRLQAALIGMYQGVISFFPVMYDVFTQGVGISPFSFQFDQGFLLLPIVASLMISTVAAGAVGGYLGSIFSRKSVLTDDEQESTE